MPDRTRRWFRELTPLGVMLLYLVAGAAWIYGSDWAVNRLFTNPRSLAWAQMLKGWAFILASGMALYWFTVRLMEARRAAERSAHESRLDYQRLVDAASDGIWVVDGAGTTVEVNDRLAALLGVERSALLGRGIENRFDHTALGLPDSGRPSSRAASVVQEVQFNRPDSSPVWAIVSRIPMRDAGGSRKGELRIVTDISDKHRAEEATRRALATQRLLLAELDHRVRNNLASLMTIVDLTRSSAVSIEDFAGAVGGRIRAMAAAHTLLAQGHWNDVDLERLIREVAAAARSDHRILTSGPPTPIRAEQAGAVAIVLHELISNSVQHGSLGAPAGAVDVSWQIIPSLTRAADPRVDIRWLERAGPAIQRDPRLGLGLTLVAGLVRSDLAGDFKAEFPETGARVRIDFPLRTPFPPVPHRPVSTSGHSHPNVPAVSSE